MALRERTPESVQNLVTGRAHAAGFRPILAAADAGFADPFLFEEGGVTYLFFERYSYAERKGTIWCCELRADGSPTEPRLVLEAEHHLSYPHVFRAGAEIYLLPESADAGEVVLYRAAEFPLRWTRERTLLELRAVDPTLLEHGGRLWLFVNPFERGGSPDEELHLYHADSLAGPWVSHPANPLVSDVRRARGAGRIVRLGDLLVRPAQDCSRAYGAAVVFNRIEVLTESEYVETPLGRLGATWLPGLTATHAYEFDGRFELTDGRRLRRYR